MKKRLFGILLSFAMMLTMMPVLGITQMAYAAEFTSLKKGDVLHLGDTINSTTEYQIGTGTYLITSFNPWTLVRVGIDGDKIVDNPEGRYYCFKSKNGYYTMSYDPHSGVDGVYFEATKISDGIEVTSVVTPVVEFAVHDPVLWVGGVQVTSANMNDVLVNDPVNAGKVSYTPAKDGAHAKLTLKGANITEGYKPNPSGYSYGIYYTGNESLDITLESDSENTIEIKDASYGIYSGNADLAINGKGKITVIGSKCGISIEYYGVNWKLTIEDASVNASVTNVNQAAVEAKNIEIINANVTATAKDKGVGIYAVDGVTIEGGTVTASGGHQAIIGTVRNSIAGTGWYDTEGTGTEHAIKINENPGQTLDYKKVQFPAVVKVTVKFDSAGGSAVKAQTINKGAKATKPADDPTKDGYTFDGWYLGSTAFDFSTAVNEDITLVAHWKKNSTPTGQSTITYDLNGGTLNGETGKVAVKVNNGTEITLPAPTRDGYTFDYWEGSKYNAGDKYTVNGDHTFKAVWKTGASGDGSKGGSSSGKNGVKTGDTNDIAGLLVLMLASGGALGAMGYRRRKER